MTATRETRLLENAIAISADLFTADGSETRRDELSDRVGGFMGWVEIIRETAVALTTVEDGRQLYDDGEGLDWYDVTAEIAVGILERPANHPEDIVEEALQRAAERRERSERREG